MTMTCRLCASLLAVATIATAWFTPTRPLSPARPTITIAPAAELPASAVTWCPDEATIQGRTYEAWMVRRC